jgi:hypothetical protein
LTVSGISRVLDDTTRQVIEAYLTVRRDRWPHTANPHLLVTQRTAQDKRPVSPYWTRTQLRGLDAPSTRSAWTANSRKPSPPVPILDTPAEQHPSSSHGRPHPSA